MQVDPEHPPGAPLQAAEGSDPRRLALAAASRWLMAGRPKDARGRLGPALAEAPGDYEVRSLAAWCALALEDWAEAEEHALAARAADPGSAEAAALLARALEGAERWGEAETHWIEAIRLDPESAEHWSGYGHLMLDMGEYSKARRLYRRALEFQPGSTEALAGLAFANLARFRGRKARHFADLAMELGPAHGHAVAAMAGAMYLNGRPFEALRLVRQLLAEFPENRAIEKYFLELDRNCRWLLWPKYVSDLFVARLPGGVFTLWGIVYLAVSFSGPEYREWKLPLGTGWVLFVLYTWVADPLGKLWVRWVPPR